jgi:hypothetical protein
MLAHKADEIHSNDFAGISEDWNGSLGQLRASVGKIGESE